MTDARHGALYFVDALILVATAAVGIVVTFDWDVPGRPLLALILLLFSPGWVFLRLVRAPLELFTLLLAASLSMAFTMLLTLLLTTHLGWAWQASVVITSIGCLGGMLIALLRRPIQTYHVTEPPKAVPHAGPRVLRSVAPYVWGVVGVAIAAMGIAATDVASVGEWGLIEGIPPWYFVGTTFLVIGVLTNIWSSAEQRLAAAWVHLIALIVMIHGVAAFAEPNPRFSVAWLHVAFADHIAGGGELLQSADARFSWPGFFTAAGYLERVAGTESTLWALALAPAIVNIASAAVVYDLGLTLGLTRVRSTAAALVFVLLNWIGQDYFAPQAVAFLLVFVIVNLVLRNLGTAPVSIRRLSRLAGTATLTPYRPYAGGGRLLTSGIVVALSAGLIISHQLSPVMLACILGGLAVLQRTSTYRLTAVILVAFVGWLSYAAEAYWLGHSEILFGSVGEVSSIMSENVSERSQAGGDGRQSIVQLRMLTMLSAWVLAGAQLLLLRRRRLLDRAFVVLLAAPFVPLLLQPYGGEGLLRVALFSLPAVAMLIASIDPASVTVTRPAKYAVAAGATAVAAALVPLLMITRYGNESYEMVTDDDLAVYDATAEILDDRDPDDADQIRIFSFSQPGPLLIGRMEYYASAKRLPRIPERAAAVLSEDIRAGRDVLIMLPRSHIVEREQVDGFARNWEEQYLEELGTLVSLRVIGNTDDGTLIRVVGDSRT